MAKYVRFSLLFFWCALLTWLAYGRSLALPLFFDDLTQLPYAATHSYGQLWQTAQFAYYRPLNFVIWKLFYDLRGYQDPVLNHALNLLLHALNGVMVGVLASPQVGKSPATSGSNHLFTPSPVYSLLPATFYLLFPFSYQGVPWIGSLNHLLVIFLIGVSLLAYIRWREGKRPFWFITSLFCAVLAPFAHENGVLVGPLVLMWEWASLQAGKAISNDQQTTSHLQPKVVQPKAVQPKAARTSSPLYPLVPFLWFVPDLFWFFIWWNIPKGEGLFINGWEGIWQNSTYFVQGAMYPLTWVGGWLKTRYGWNDLAVVWGLSVVGLGTAVFLSIRTRRFTLYPWLWSLLSALPVIIFLKFDYVINGPRLLMLASVGLAWGWGAVVTTQWLLLSAQLTASHKRFMIHILRFALVLFVSITLAQNYLFIRERMWLHEMLGSAVFQTIAATQTANEAGETAVVINFPSWLAPESTYALGHEGVLFWPDYVPHDALISAHTGQPADLTFVRVDGIRPEMPYFYGLTGAAPQWESLAEKTTDVFVAVYTLEQVEILLAGRFNQLAASNQIAAHFLNSEGKTAVSLLAADVIAESGRTRVNLLWSAPIPPENVTVFVHLLDSNGQLMAQADGDPIAGTYPFSLWQPEQVVADVRYVATVNPPTAVLVGLYNRTTGERLLATSPDGTPLPDNAATISID